MIAIIAAAAVLVLAGGGFAVWTWAIPHDGLTSEQRAAAKQWAAEATIAPADLEQVDITIDAGELAFLEATVPDGFSWYANTRELPTVEHLLGEGFTIIGPDSVPEGLLDEDSTAYLVELERNDFACQVGVEVKIDNCTVRGKVTFAWAPPGGEPPSGVVIAPQNDLAKEMTTAYLTENGFTPHLVLVKDSLVEDLTFPERLVHAHLVADGPPVGTVSVPDGLTAYLDGLTGDFTPYVFTDAIPSAEDLGMDGGLCMAVSDPHDVPSDFMDLGQAADVEWQEARGPTTWSPGDEPLVVLVERASMAESIADAIERCRTPMGDSDEIRASARLVLMNAKDAADADVPDLIKAVLVG